MRRNIAAGELFEVRGVDQSHFPAFLEGGFHAEPVANGSTDRPERSHPNRGCTVNEHRPVGRVVGDLQELIDLRVRGVHVDDGDIKVLETGLFDGGPLLVRAVLGGLTQVQDRLYSLGLQLGEVLQPRLAAGAELRRDLQEIANGGELLLTRRGSL